MNNWINEHCAKFSSLKEAVLNHYGNNSTACVNCGINDIRVLCIDHINNDGKEHREYVGGDNRIYNWLIDNDFPPGFQTLCMNCNWIKYREQKKPRRRRSNSIQPIKIKSYSKPTHCLPDRVRTLISYFNDKPFRTHDIRILLPLTAQDQKNLRVVIHRMLKAGEIERLDINKRYYRMVDK